MKLHYKMGAAAEVKADLPRRAEVVLEHCTRMSKEFTMFVRHKYRQQQKETRYD